MLKQLSKELTKKFTKEFGRGFSYANLRNLRQVYLIYPEGTNCYALRSNLSWTHHRTIMRIDEEAKRSYYIEQCSKENWSSRILERQIQSQTYQRLLSSKQSDNTGTEIKSKDTNKLSLLKDLYVLDFLNILTRWLIRRHV